MESYDDIIREEKRKTAVVFTFGRFNCVTRGHAVLIDSVINTAKKKNAEPRIYTSQKQDPKKNPLSFKDKVFYLTKFFPKARIVLDPSIKTPFHVLKSLSDQGYKDVTFVVGGDRADEFERNMRPYVNHPDKAKSFDFDSFEVINSGARVKGVSGTDMRKHARNDDFVSFYAGLPKGISKRDAQKLFDSVREGMDL